MYNIEINKSRKLFIIKGLGSYNESELHEFIDEFKAKISVVNTKDYNLVLDTTKLKTSHQNSTSIMGEIMNLYFDTPFTGRFYLRPESPTARIQMRRATDSSSFKTLTEVTSINEIF